MGACGEHEATCSLIRVGPRRDVCVVAPRRCPRHRACHRTERRGARQDVIEGDSARAPVRWSRREEAHADKRRGAAPAGGPRLDADVVLQRASRAGMQSNTDRESAVLNASSTPDGTPPRRGRSQEGRRNGGTRSRGEGGREGRAGRRDRVPAGEGVLGAARPESDHPTEAPASCLPEIDQSASGGPADDPVRVPLARGTRARGTPARGPGARRWECAHSAGPRHALGAWVHLV